MTNEEKQRAKEKAEELVYKFIEKDLIKTDYFDHELCLEIYSSSVELENAKQCALIAVTEIWDALESERVFEKYDYYQQVKKEIEAM